MNRPGQFHSLTQKHMSQGVPGAPPSLLALIRKKCAGNSVLLATSCHPAHTSRSVPLGECIRAKRNCSTEESFAQECDTIQD